MTQRRYPLSALLEATGLTEHELSMKLRSKGIFFHGTPLKRARENGLVEKSADRLACAVGFVPWLVWPEMRDDIIEDCSTPCGECGNPFVPKRKGHRFCDVPECVQEHKRRIDREAKARRRREEPGYAEAERLRHRKYADSERARQIKARKQKAYHQANKERINARLREYRAANAERLRARRREQYRAKKAAA